MAHLKAFSKRKNIFAEPSINLAFLGTLADVIHNFLAFLGTLADVIHNFCCKVMLSNSHTDIHAKTDLAKIQVFPDGNEF